jgi:hypothetical protein
MKKPDRKVWLFYMGRVTQDVGAIHDREICSFVGWVEQSDTHAAGPVAQCIGGV